MPVGKPAAEREMDCEAPASRVALRLVVAEAPCGTDGLLAIEREKSNEGACEMVKVALASALAVAPLLNALALTTAVVVREKGVV
jgi:hypothetical protein